MTGRRWKNPMLCLFLSFVCRKSHNERGGNKMPDLCFYAPWIMKEPIPDPFRVMLEKAGKKRVSYDEADCSMRNIRKQGKVSRLHGPTLQALLTLIQIRKEKDSGAAGIQRGRDTINYFCMEYPGNQGKYVMTYNSKNGRFSGILKTEEKTRNFRESGRAKTQASSTWPFWLMPIWSRIILYLTKSSKKISTYWKNRKKRNGKTRKLH